MSRIDQSDHAGRSMQITVHVMNCGLHPRCREDYSILTGYLEAKRVPVMQLHLLRYRAEQGKAENGQRPVENNQQKSLKGFTQMRLAFVQNSLFAK